MMRNRQHPLQQQQQEQRLVQKVLVRLLLSSCCYCYFFDSFVWNEYVEAFQFIEKKSSSSLIHHSKKHEQQQQLLCDFPYHNPFLTTNNHRMIHNNNNNKRIRTSFPTILFLTTIKQQQQQQQQNNNNNNNNIHFGSDISRLKNWKRKSRCTNNNNVHVMKRKNTYLFVGNSNTAAGAAATDSLNHDLSLSSSKTTITTTQSCSDVVNEIQNDSSNDNNNNNNNSNNTYQIRILYCTGCRWGLRAFWMAQELLTTTFSLYKTTTSATTTTITTTTPIPTTFLQSVTLVPSRPPEKGGQYIIELYHIKKQQKQKQQQEEKNENKIGTSSTEVKVTTLWDRSVKGGTFPEPQEVIQLIQKEIIEYNSNSNNNTDDNENDGNQPIRSIQKNDNDHNDVDEESNDHSFRIPYVVGQVPPHVGIMYNTGRMLTDTVATATDGTAIDGSSGNSAAIAGIGLLLRASYYCQELMSTFADEINSISLLPIMTTTTNDCMINTKNKVQSLNDKDVDDHDTTTANKSTRTAVPSSKMLVVYMNEKTVLWEQILENQQQQQEQQQSISTFLPTKVLKQLVRDQLNPCIDLGHSDTDEKKKKIISIQKESQQHDNEQHEQEQKDEPPPTTFIIHHPIPPPSPLIHNTETDIDEIDDDTAEEARKFFGVL